MASASRAANRLDWPFACSASDSCCRAAASDCRAVASDFSTALRASLSSAACCLADRASKADIAAMSTRAPQNDVIPVAAQGRPAPDPGAFPGPDRPRESRLASQEPTQVFDELGGVLVAVFRSLATGLLDDRLQIPRDPRVNQAWRFRLAIMNRFQQVDLVGLGKSRLEGRQLVEREPSE